MENLKKLSRNGQKIIVRFPLVPGVNDDEKDILELGEFVSSLPNVKKLSILPYHKAGVEKCKRLGKPTDLVFINRSPCAERLTEIKEKLESFGLKIQIGG